MITLKIDNGTEDGIDREIILYQTSMDGPHNDLVMHVNWGPHVETKGPIHHRKAQPEDMNQAFVLTPQDRLKLIHALMNM